MGGLIASLLAGQLKEEIEKLILLAPTGTLPERIQQRVVEVPYVANQRAYDFGGNLVGRGFVDELKEIEVWSLAGEYPNQVLLIQALWMKLYHMKCRLSI
jgi:pimeloyl-ACP methyl ester carboxylesterase